MTKFLTILSLFCTFSGLFAENNLEELWPIKPNEAQLTHYPNESQLCILICPGGRYGGHAIQPEGHGIAKWLKQNGYASAVLKYRLPKGRHDVPLTDVNKALSLLKSKYKQVGILGFSAGGHLAGSSLTLLKTEERPAFGILIYPVITFGKHTHQGSRKNLVGSTPNPTLYERYSLEKQVDSACPPVFLAHAKDDKPVPIENSQLFYEAAKKVQKHTKLLTLEKGGHGLNGYKGPSWDRWQRESLIWIKSLPLK